MKKSERGKKKIKTIKQHPYNKFSNAVISVMNDFRTKGNYKDYVVFVGDQLIDRYCSYTVTRKDVPPDDTVMLLHKSKLISVAGEEWGNKFWDFSYNKRTNFGIENIKNYSETL